VTCALAGPQADGFLAVGHHVRIRLNTTGVSANKNSDHQQAILRARVDPAEQRPCELMTMNVRFLGNQDTLLLDSNRSYVLNTYIEGTEDFIFGAGTSVFSNCSVFMKSTTGGTITAAATPAGTAYGFLFYKSAITGAAAGVTTLGRPWGASAQVLYRESTLSVAIASAQPWINMSSNVWQNARFDEYLNTGAGATINGNRPQMTAAQAASYTPAAYLAGSDGWNPL
jgi:pectinesterase